ncbi:MAG: PAS domain S-box protein [Myxococcota bacterium]|nr:PAS domain S-box protein [Myxococcota bacterium]
MHRPHDVLATLDNGVLGKTMLDAARAAGIGVTVTLIDSPTPRNVYVSEAAASIFGRTVDEMLEGDPMAHIAPEDLPRMRERFVLRAKGESGEKTTEMVALRKDGTGVPLEVTATYVTIDGHPAVFAFIVDVSERRAAEQQRQRNDARFRELIESGPEPIGIVRGGHFVYANRAYVAALGFADARSLYETPINTLLAPEEAAIRDAREAQILERRLQPPQIFRVRRRDGSMLLLEVSSVYFEYQGKPSVLVMARDITARRHLEMQLVQADRLAALGTMAAGAAHEINNPLAYVMLNLEWIARKLPGVMDDPSSIAGLMVMLEEARHGVQRVTTIVRELRSFSRADGETRRPVDLETAVKAAIRITGHEIRHRATLTTSFEAVRPVWGNQARIEQVVINLLMNAAQAVPETRRAEANEIHVTVREDAAGRAILEVSDNGEGISVEVQSRIFDPFFTTKQVGVGTGLGLSICHAIVTSLGGEIAVYSEPGDGATFRVALPTTNLNMADTPSAAPELPRSIEGRRARVLVIDDEPPIANTMRELLGVEHDVLLALSAREALVMIHSGAGFDVIFCDLMMPGMSGVDLFEQVRAQRPGLERKIVFMTGGAFTARAAEFLASIDNRRIEKPFSLGLLERIVLEMADVAEGPR